MAPRKDPAGLRERLVGKIQKTATLEESGTIAGEGAGWLTYRPVHEEPLIAG